MTNTTNYQLKKVEGNDLFNPLTQINPNWDDIDEAMKANQDAGVTNATHNKSGTLHAIVRSTAGVPVLRFTATGDFRTGDTFTVDGQNVTARLPDGTSLPDYAFRINSNIIAIQAGGILTIVTNGASVNLEGYMETSDYVGSGATGKVRAAEVADSATTATSANNASNLNGQPANYYAAAAALAPMIQNVTAIQVVTQLPTNPVATTLYLVTE
jgi:hypothetical protein